MRLAGLEDIGFDVSWLVCPGVTVIRASISMIGVSRLFFPLKFFRFAGFALTGVPILWKMIVYKVGE